MKFISNTNKKELWKMRSTESKVEFSPNISASIYSGTLTDYEQWYLKTFGRFSNYEI